MALFAKASVVAVIACMTSLMSGCTSSTLVDVWHDSSFQTRPLRNMMVVAVMKDATKRRIWEDAFRGELMKHGVAVTTSYTLFHDAPPDTNQVLVTVEANRFDGILVILSLPSDTNSRHVEGYTTIEQDYGANPPTHRKVRYVYKDSSAVENVRYISYWRRYRTYYREIEHPGYTDTQTTDIRAIDVTTTGKDGRLIWSATSRTPGPGSVTDVQRGIAGLVISELTRRRIIDVEK